ncbi:MAG: D-2-hydroxyacid dehydrogenase [Cyclobacteriaceae bacterium]
MSNEIVILDGIYANPGDLSWENLDRYGKVRIYDRTADEDVIDRCADAEVVVTNKVRLGKDHFEQLPNLKLIVISATGTDHIDLDAAKEHDILVKNVKGYSTHAVAQQVFSLIFALTNHVEKHDQSVQKGDWNRDKGFSYTLNTIHEVRDKTLGIYGFGQIGQEVASIGLAFGMRILAVSQHADPKSYPDYGFGTLEEMISTADIVSLHAPLTDKNHQIIDQTLINSMKPNALLINTARGALVNEQDLASALKQNRIAGAGLDVLSQEPPAKDHPLIGLDNCLLTPHLAWASKEARTKLINAIVTHVSSYYSNK